MLRCEQTLCRYCFKHYTGTLVCNSPAEPVLVPRSAEMQPNILQCGMFRNREHDDQTLNELQPGRGADGLYPGQLKEPK